MNLIERFSLAAAALAVAAGSIAFSAPAMSQDLEIEEIVVTARKREESLLEVPVAITAFGFDEMDRKGFTSLQDLSFVTAGLHYNKQAGQVPGRFNTAVRFRGMDTNQSAASQQLGTVFLDGVYMSNGIAGIDFSNIERVEVIKGPQSATFGRSTFAGAVNYVTRTPGFEYQGRVSADMSDYGGYDVSISHEGPIIKDKLAYRFSARGYGTDGQYESNADGGELGIEQTQTLQGVIYATPTENFTAKLRYFYSQDVDGPAAALFLGTPLSDRGSGSADAAPNCYRDRPEEQANGAIANYFCGPLPKVDVDTFISPNTEVGDFELAAFGAPTFTNAGTGLTWQKIPGIPFVTSPGLKRNQQRWALLLDYDFTGAMEGYSLHSVTGYSDMRANWVRDFDFTRAEALMSQDPQLHEDKTQELRIQSPSDRRFRWFLGYSYFEAEFIQQGNGGMSVSNGDGLGCTILPGGFCNPGPNIGGFTNFPIESGETSAIFGSLSFDITEDLTVDFEWRSQDDEISQDNRSPTGVAGPEFVDSFDSFLPRFTVSYNPTDSSTIWATYSEGNIPGFFNTDLGGLSQFELDQVDAFVGGTASFFNEEEELENTEIGWKQQLFDNRLYFSLVVYKMDWTNLKTRSGVPIIRMDGSENVLNLQFNAGNAELDGIELEGGFALGEHLTGNFTLNLVNAEYGVLTCGFSPFKAPNIPGRPGQRDCSGNTPARFPDASYSVGLNWTDNLGSSEWDYFILGDAHYFGKAFNEEANFSTIGEFWRVNLRGGFEKDRLRIEGYVRNLFDNDDYLAGARWSDFSTGVTFGFLFSQGVAVTPAEKRTIGLKAVFEF